jgi:hypothetical protein
MPGYVFWYCQGQTYVYVFGQELVRYAVLIHDIVVHAGAGRGGTGEEAEKSGSC